MRVTISVGKQHIIELNGQRYDTVTGKIITSDSSSKAKPQKPKHLLQGKSMDGFARSSKHSRHINPHSSRKTEKSKTLMRGTVNKPSSKTAHSSTSPSAANINKILSAKVVSQDKLARAVSAPKSSLVRRFYDGTPRRPILPTKNTVKKQSPHKPLQHRTEPAQTHSKAANLLMRGLANANSHEQIKTKRAPKHARLAKQLRISPNMLSGGSIALAALLIAGFFAYQNTPNINMRLASSRSGVAGSLPEFQPAGFALDRKITYQPGQIVLDYKSNTDDRQFKIIQQSSAWNSETLVNNFFGDANCAAKCQVAQDRGKTIYLYNGNNATWVDGGIWFRVEGNSQLNSDQLLNIAASL